MSFKGFQWLLRAAACIGAMSAAALPAQAILSVGEVQFHLLGRYETGLFKESAAEIVAHDPGTQRLFVTNATGKIDVLSIADPSNPTLITSIDLSPYGSAPNSVAVSNGILAIAVEAVDKQANGRAVFFNANDPTFANPLNSIIVGALPDMLTFTPDGTKVLVANEGEPDDYGPGNNDPVGSVSIIHIPNGNVAAATVTTVGFEDFNVGGSRHGELPADVRIFGPGATVAQDIEPEYIAISADGLKAYVALQENNAFAIIDIPTGTIDKIVALGKKDHSLPGNGFDPSDRDGVINIANFPVFGLYMPDGIASYEVNGKTFIVSANEGDARDYDGFSEELRVGSGAFVLDPAVFPNAADLKNNAALGRLTVTTAAVPTNAQGEFTEIHAFGARSFSIWDDQGVLVWDSGDQFEQILKDLLPDHFNSNHDEGPSFDNRSDNKGPEPEGVTIGILNDRIFAFIGLERIGGIMVYDVTNPENPFFAGYVNSRVFGATYDEDSFPNAALLSSLGDLGPEGLIFISAADSPNGRSLIVLASEVSGTTSIFQVGVVPEPATGMLAMLGLGALMLRRSRA